MTSVKKPERSERRYVIVTDSRDGTEYRVLTSLAKPGFALISFTPSNEHLAGALNGMLLTHGDVIRGEVYADASAAERAIARLRKLESSQRATGTQFFNATVKETAQ